MLRSLRNRLILSHVLLLLIVIPLMGAALVYVLETQFLIPTLARNLIGNARMLAEISRAEYEAWGNPVLFGSILQRVQQDPATRVMFLSPFGQLLYSSDPGEVALLGGFVSTSGVQQASQGEESAYTNYTPLRLKNILIDVYSPVVDDTGHVIGIVRVTYLINSLYAVFGQLRSLTSGVLFLGILLGALLGSILAVNIIRPVRRVTQAIYDLARGERRHPLVEAGPEEIRAQIRAVNFLVNRLDNLEQARRQLLANLVHELGRPLGALRSAIHALSKGAGQNPQLLAELTTGMEEETNRLRHVLDDLAHLHDQVLGALELNRETIQLSEWLPKVLLPWEQLARDKRIHWMLQLAPDLPALYADPVRLAQVIGNLASNAVKYTPAGRSVSISTGTQDDQIWIQVSDTGPGIPPAEQEKIFTPFYRGDQGRRIKQGMGLGLTIARELAQAHGGRLTLESTPGLGSQFTLWIPVKTE